MHRLILIAACLAACGGPAPPHTFVFRGSEAGLVTARAAAAEWGICGRQLTVATEGDGVPIVEVDDIDGMHMGVTDRGDGDEVTAVRFVLYANAQATLAHELGHTQGLPHAATGLMVAEAIPGDVPRVTAIECGALAALYGHGVTRP